jgi:glycosyltransferase involved in cell wall biosynthesis
MRVLVLAPYPFDTAPGQRYRIEQWMPYLEREGVSFHFDGFVSPELQRVLYQRGKFFRKSAYLLRDYLARLARILRVRDYDVILICREAALVGPAWIERIVKRSGIPIVYDFDDAIWVRYVSPSNGYFSYVKFPGKTAKICALADHVIVGNEFLRGYAVHKNPNVTIVPTTIDTQKYRLSCSYVLHGEPVVGWTGSHSSIAYLEALRPALQEVSKRIPFTLLTVGVPDFRMEGVRVRAIEWRSATEAADLAPIHVGVMPLPDEPWAQGKCACKALQYMALGVPTIVSPVGVNRALIRAGENGFHATSTEEWVATLSSLLADQELRARVGRAGRSTVEAQYSACVQAPRVLEVFESVVDRNLTTCRSRSR